MLFFSRFIFMICFLSKKLQRENTPEREATATDNGNANEGGNVAYNFHSEVDVGEHNLQIVKIEGSHIAPELTLANEGSLEAEQVDSLVPSQSSSQPEPPTATGSGCSSMCKKCGKVLRSKLYLPNHRAYYHTPTNCKFCNKTFLGKNLLRDHLISVHQKRTKCPCPFCPDFFFYAIRRSEHIAKANADQQRFCCIFCTEIFWSGQNLEEHVGSVHQNPVLYCRHCGKIFKVEKPLTYHVKKCSQNPCAPNRRKFFISPRRRRREERVGLI